MTASTAATDVDLFEGARDLAKAAANRVQAAADNGQREQVSMWAFVVDAWTRVADLYRERP